jgi:uncharacterized repeat protein (TIGR03803 family)
LRFLYNQKKGISPKEEEFMNRIIAISKKWALNHSNSQAAGSMGKLIPESRQGRCNSPRWIWKQAFAVVLLCAVTTIRAAADKPKGPAPPPYETLANMDFDGPVGALVQGMDGNFYGVTSSGGEFGQGSIFSVTPGGIVTTLHSFNGNDGYNLTAGLVLGMDGNFYGTAPNGGTNINGSCQSENGQPPGICGTVFKFDPTPGGSGFMVLYNFDFTHGSSPQSGLVLGFDGNFYGTTSAGGNGNCGVVGCGTVFKITPGGSLTTIYNFCGNSDCPIAPNASALVQGIDGNFYGTTSSGGIDNCMGVNGPVPCGTVFRITPGGAPNTLYTFCLQSGCPDGLYPNAALALGWDGNFYGTTQFGGSYGSGTVFRITPTTRELKTVYNFCSESSEGYCADGENPGALTLGSDGNFYGTTSNGGESIDIGCCGTLFQFIPGDMRNPEGTLTRCTFSITLSTVMGAKG